MAHRVRNNDEFNWGAAEFFLAFLAGVGAVAGIWLFTGLMIGLLFL